MSNSTASYRVKADDGIKLPVGTALKLASDGRLYDDKGNQVAKWECRDDERNEELAKYASRLSAYGGVASARQAKHELASETSKALAMRWEEVLSRKGIDDDRPITMDLGPGDVHIPSAMPNFASGYRNEPPMADLACPVLLANKEVDSFFQFAKEDAFQRATPIGAAGGAQVAEIAPRLSTSQYQTRERALGGYVSTQLEANADAPLRLLQATTKRVMNALILEREMRVQALLRTSGNWDSSVVSTLGSGFQWDGGPSSDPVKDIHARLEASWGGVTGIFMSEKVWHAFVRNPAVRGYYAFKNDTAPVPKASDISAILDLPPIYVSKMKYITSSGTLDYVWGGDVVLVRQPDEMPPTSQEDVATAYTFRWNVQNPKDGVANGGFIIRQYWNQHRGSMGGLQVVVVHHDAEMFTSKFVGGLIQNAYQ